MGKDQFVAGVVVVAALLACKKREAPAPPPEPARPAVTAAEVTPARHPSGAPTATKRDTVAPLAVELDKLRRTPDAQAEGVDRTGKRTLTWRFKPLPDTDLVELARYRENTAAWRLEISGLPCRDLDQLGLEVVQISENRGMAPHFRAWYRISGGPLDGTFALVSNQGVPAPKLCTILPGTNAYWDLAGRTIGE